MARIMRRRGFSLADLNGHEIGPPPAVLPAYEGRPPSMCAQVLMMTEKIYPNDPVFRKQVCSISNADAATGSHKGDKALAAARILLQAKEDKIAPLADQDIGIIGKIMKSWLPAAMEKHGMSRQARIGAAIERGRAVDSQGDDAAE